MPKYKVRVCEPGDFLHGDGDVWVCADTVDQAREFFEDYGYNDGSARFLTSLLGRPRVVRKVDIENGDCHEDAEPGDTTWDFFPDDGRETDPDSEIRRFWEMGSWRPWTCVQTGWGVWKGRGAPVSSVVAGIPCSHARHGRGETLGPAREIGGKRKWIDVRFEDGSERVVSCRVLDLFMTRDWPPKAAQVNTADGPEYIAYGTDEGCLRALAEIRADRLQAEWEADQIARGLAA